MSRIPRWLKVVLGIFIVLIVIGLALPFVIDVDRYRDTIANAVKDQTGREVKIGKLRARFIPSVGFTVEKLDIGNPAGFPEGNVISVDEITGGLAIGPLLSRQIQVTSLTVDHPTLTLLTDPQGKTNYDFSPPKKAGAKEAAPESSAFQLAAIPEIKLKNVEMIVGSVAHGKSGFIQSVRAKGLDVEIGNLVLEKGGVKKWTADADLSGLKAEIAGFRDPVELKSGELKLRNGAIDSKFEGSIGKSIHAKGTMDVADVEKGVPRIDLSTNLLDLEALMNESVPSPSAPSSATTKNELVAQGQISAAKVRLAPYEAENAKASLKLYSDRIEIAPLTAGLYGGSVNLSGTVNTAQTPSRMNASLKISNLNMQKACDVMPSTRNALTGTGELTLQLNAPLNASFLNAAAGTGNLAVRDGSFPNFHLSALDSLSKLGQLLSGDFQGAASKGGSKGTTFSIINGDLNIAAGRVMSNRIHMDSNLGTMDLKGSFGFDQTLDYDGQATLSGSSAGGGASSPQSILTGILGKATSQSVQSMSIPFAVRGTFDKPKIVPGKGIPSFKTAPAQQSPSTQQQQPQQKKSLLDLFKKP